MKWQYEIVKRTHEDGYEEFGVHEYFSDTGEDPNDARPSITVDPVEVAGDSAKEVIEKLRMMLKDVEGGEVLNWEDF